MLFYLTINSEVRFKAMDQPDHLMLVIATAACKV